MPHKTKSLAAADEIRRRIVAGKYLPGRKLSQDNLAIELGMSRMPIRDALVLLEAEGLVRNSPHRGATVAQLSSDEMEELFGMRALLEPFLLRRSAPRFTDGDLSDLNGMLEEQSAFLAAFEPISWNAMDAKFHLKLYSRAKSSRIFYAVTALIQECDRNTRFLIADDKEHHDRAVMEHVELLRLCQFQAYDAAAEMMKVHVERTGANVVSLLTHQNHC